MRRWPIGTCGGNVRENDSHGKPSCSFARLFFLKESGVSPITLATALVRSAATVPSGCPLVGGFTGRCRIGSICGARKRITRGPGKSEASAVRENPRLAERDPAPQRGREGWHPRFAD